MSNNYSVEEKLAVDEAIISSVGDGLVATDKEGGILVMNSAAEKMLLQKAKEVIGKNYVEVVPAADKSGKIIPGEKRPLYEVLRAGKSFTNHSANFYVRGDGTKFSAAITTSPIIYKSSIIGAIITFRDVTHEKQVDRVKNEFLSLAAHQLRTPLSAVSWFAEMLISGDAGELNKEQKEFLDNIYQSVHRMTDLVNDLLSLSRLELGRIVIKPELSDLNMLLNDVLKDLNDKIVAKRQTIIVNNEKNLPEILVDRNLIRVVYLNLLSNSLKYSPPEGKITVSIAREGEDIISKIEDSGYGIPENEQSKLFQRFFRASNIMQKVSEGTGLGLYLVKVILNASGGRIWFESVEDKGTTFWFSLPVNGILAKKEEVKIDDSKMT